MHKKHLKAIEEIIHDFIGDTIMGNHLFKALKAYFRSIEDERVPNTSQYKSPSKISFDDLKKTSTHKAFTEKIKKEAHEAMIRYGEKLKKDLKKYKKGVKNGIKVS